MKPMSPRRRSLVWAWLLGLALQAVALSSQALEARVRAAVDLEADAWIGQQVVLQIDLMTSGLSFSGQRIHLPDVPGALVLEDAVSTVKLSERIDGESWQVLGYRYPLFAQRPGRIEIGAVAVAFKVSEGYGSEVVAFDLKTEALAFEVLSPPGVDDPSKLVTSTDFSLQVVVIPESVDLRVGDALTRNITRRARGVSGMAFAPLPVPDIPGVASYPKSPEVNDSIYRGNLEGTRVDSVTYVLQQPGEFTIPEIQLQWWDPVAERLHTETIPALRFVVATNPQLTDPGTDYLVQIQGWVWLHPWRMLTLILGVVAALWAMFHWAPVGIHRLRYWRLARRQSESARFKRLLKACRSNDPLRIYNAYVKWQSSDDSLVRVIQVDPKLNMELQRLQTALIHHGSGWRADALMQQLQRTRRRVRRTQQMTENPALPDLNPSRSL